MPMCTYITLEEAQIATHPRYAVREVMAEYLVYIRGVPRGWAGRLHVAEWEPVDAITVRRLLAAVANAFNYRLTIKRTGQDVYFWQEEEPAR
jgi:hypothetical protein